MPVVEQALHSSVSLSSPNTVNGAFIPYTAPTAAPSATESQEPDEGHAFVPSHLLASSRANGHSDEVAQNTEGSSLVGGDGEENDRGVEWATERVRPQTREIVSTSATYQIPTISGQALSLSLPRSYGTEGEGGDTSINVNVVQEQDELQLLSHYRYKIATMFDLEIGDLYYGIEVLLIAKSSSHVYKALLAAARCHQSAVNNAYVEQESQIGTNTSGEDFRIEHNVSLDEVLIQSVMAAFRILINETPLLWLQKLHHTAFRIIEPNSSSSGQSMSFRLVLAAILMASPSRGNSGLVLFYLDTILHNFGTAVNTHSHYDLQPVLILLAQSIGFLPSVSRPGKIQVDVWQSHWQKLSEWYANRTFEMQEILQLSDSESDPSETRVFPLVLFSNAYALVANTVYHLAAFILLQSKPRLVKISIRHAPARSWIWHIQRIMGIAHVAAGNGFWDPVVVAAVIHSAKLLSHYQQRQVAAQVLTAFATVSGMKLQQQIGELVTPEAV